MAFTRRAQKYKELYTTIANKTKLFCNSYLSMIRARLKSVVDKSMPSINQKEYPVTYKYVFVSLQKQITLNELLHTLYYDSTLPKFVKHIIDTELMRILAHYKTWQETYQGFEKHERSVVPLLMAEFDISLELTKQQFERISKSIETFVHIPECSTIELLSLLVGTDKWPIKVSTSGLQLLVELVQLTRNTIQAVLPITDELFKELTKEEKQLILAAQSVEKELEKLKRTYKDRYFVDIEGLNTKILASELTAIYYGELMLMVSLLTNHREGTALVSLLLMLYDLSGLRFISVLSSLLYSIGKANDFDRIEIRDTETDEAILSVPIIPENKQDLIYRYCGYLV